MAYRWEKWSCVAQGGLGPFGLMGATCVGLAEAACRLEVSMAGNDDCVCKGLVSGVHGPLARIPWKVMPAK
jgi:hypothetical protein